MSLAEELNPEQLAQNILQEAPAFLGKAGLPEEEMESALNLLFVFTRIAGEQITQESELEIPGSQEKIPCTKALAEQCVELFYIGLAHAIIKSWEYGLEEEPKTQILQSLAMEVFHHAKQISVSTFGQELTPEIQFPKEQQYEWIKQSAESALMLYMSEMGLLEEKEEENDDPSTFGQTEPMMVQETASQMPVSEAVVPEPPAAAVEEDILGFEEEPASFAPELEPYQSPPQAPLYEPAPVAPLASREKYAAVSLFLTALKPRQRRAIVGQFTPQEQQVIQYYGDPEKIEAELDLDQVQAQLLKLKNKLQQEKKQGPSAQFSSAPVEAAQAQPVLPQVSDEASLQQSILQAPRAELIQLIAQERPRIRELVAHHLKPMPGLQPTALTPAIEMALQHYIQRELKPSHS